MNDNRTRRIIIYALIGVVALWAVVIGTVLVVQAGRGPSPTPTATAQAPSPTVTQTPSPVPTAAPTEEPTSTATPELSPTPPPTVTPVPETETPTPAPSETPSKAGQEIDRGDPNSSMIALTFDAGASSEPTPKILDILKERGLKVTMFLTGKWIEQNPELVKRIQADGHEIGNHTYSHPDLTKISDREITSELAQVEKLVKQQTGQSTKPWFRPPYGARNQHVLNVAADAGYTSIYWTIDSLDWETDRSPASVLDRVTKPVDSDGHAIPLNGAIVLEHLGSPQSAEVLPQILDRIEAKGLRVVTVSELLTP